MGWPDFDEFMTGLRETLSGIVSGLVGMIKKSVTAVTKPLTDTFSAVVDSMKAGFEKAASATSIAIDGIGAGLSTVIDNLVVSVKAISTQTTRNAIDLKDWAKAGLNKVWKEAEDGFGAVKNGIVDGIKELLDKIKTAFLDFADYIIQLFKDIIELTEDAVMSMVDTMDGVQKKIIARMTESISPE